MMRRVALAALVMSACASSGKSELATLPPPKSAGPLVTAGPRCDASGKCTCREIDDFGRPSGDSSRKEGDVPAGLKRFEIRTGRGFDPMTITVDDKGTLTKDTSTVEPTCGYVDLPPGRHAVRLRIEAKDRAQGIHPRMIIDEYGRTQNDWYFTFSFACGSAGPCLKDDMKDWMEKVRATDRGIFDKCGSTRIEGVRWSVEHSPEQTLEDLTLDFVLHVYKFEPRFRHGTPTCKGISGGKGAEQEVMQGGAQDQ